MGFKQLAGFFTLFFMLTHGALAQTASQKDAIIYSVAMGNAAELQYTLPENANLNITDINGWPLLGIAASRVDGEALPMTTLLVKHGADVNFSGENQYYPIMLAAQAGNKAVVEYLLSKGASYTVKDANGANLWQYANASGNEELIEIVKNKITTDRQHHMEMTSQAGLDKMVHTMAFHSCALAYYNYYYQSGQDEVAKSTQQKTLQAHTTELKQSMQKIRQYFPIKSRELQREVYEKIQKAVVNDLHQMVSNRQRRKSGVGTDADLKERCGKWSAYFRQGTFSKAELMEDYPDWRAW